MALATLFCIFLLYRHHMSLTKNGFGKFETKLTKNKKKYFDGSNKLRNFDEPEDGLDALMQVNSNQRDAIFMHQYYE